MNSNYFDFDVEDEANFREFNSVPPDQIDPSTSAPFETVYRGVASLSSSYFDEFSSSSSFNNYLPKPVLQRENRKEIINTNILVTCNSSSSSPASRSLIAPSVPDFLMATNVEVTAPIDVIVATVENILHECDGLSFSFNKDSCQWDAVTLCGSTHCKFQVSIYTRTSGAYVVEVHRLMGDGHTSRSFFQSMKASLTGGLVNEEFDTFPGSFPLHESAHTEQVDSSLIAVLKMAREPTVEAQLEAARILCDLSLDMGLQQTLVDHGVMDVLRELINSSPSEWAQQHAIAALSTLSDAQIFQSAILKANLVPVLFRLATDGPYQTAELRRSAMHVLANLSRDCAGEVASMLGRRELAAWLSKVDGLADERLKIHASRARECLYLVC